MKEDTQIMNEPGFSNEDIYSFLKLYGKGPITTPLKFIIILLVKENLKHDLLIEYLIEKEYEKILNELIEYEQKDKKFWEKLTKKLESIKAPVPKIIKEYTNHKTMKITEKKIRELKIFLIKTHLQIVYNKEEPKPEIEDGGIISDEILEELRIGISKINHKKFIK